MGTPSYMAPEQARGDTKSAGPPADIYALGAILYEMLTGRPPFKGISAMDTVKQVIEQDPVSPSRVQFRVPRDLETICMKCLQKEPRKRYATAKDMADDLNRYLYGEPIRARRTPPIERAIKWAKRHPTGRHPVWPSGPGRAQPRSAPAAGTGSQRTLERDAEQHEAKLREETADDLIRAQEAISKNDLNQGRVVLRSRKKILEREKKPRARDPLRSDQADARGGREGLEAERVRQAEQSAKDAVQKRYRLFLDRRKEALFRDTQFTGLHAPARTSISRAKRPRTPSASSHSRATSDEWELGELPATLSSEQQAEVGEGCYELLLILAEAVATQDPRRSTVPSGSSKVPTD